MFHFLKHYPQQAQQIRQLHVFELYLAVMLVAFGYVVQHLVEKIDDKTLVS